MLSIVVFALVFGIVYSKCTSLETNCLVSVKFTEQFNVNWKGVPTYYDLLTNSYSDRECASKTITYLYHTPLNCTKETEEKFDCRGTIESVWVRVWDVENQKEIISNCGEKYAKKYQDVTKNDCVINGVDKWEYAKQHIGGGSSTTVSIRNRVPEEFDNFHYGGECVWVYEVEGFWSTLVITIFTIAIAVCLILLIALYIYANKHRAEKRTNQLNRSLVNDDVQQPAV